MKKISDESRFHNGFPVLVDIIYIGLLWLLCCLPIVTIGPASCAMYHAMVKSVRRGRGHAGATFFSAFRSNFKSSLKVWLIFLLLIALWLGNMYVNGVLDPDRASFMSGLSVWLIIPVLIPLPWVFAYISRFDNSLWDTLKYSIYLSIKNLGRTVMLLLIVSAFVLLGWLFPALIPLLPGFCCLLKSFQTEPVFKAITSRFENDSNEDKWYNE